MAKYDACIASASSTSAALSVTTKDALLYGVCAYGVATTGGQVVVSKGATVLTNIVFIAPVVGTSVGPSAPPVPIVCAGGICASCVGTNFNFVVYYSDIQK